VIYILSDVAYTESISTQAAAVDLQVPHARGSPRVLVTLTKERNLFVAGWRIGFAVGNSRLIAALGRQIYLDTGAFTPIRWAATAAFDGRMHCIERCRTLFAVARDGV